MSQKSTIHDSYVSTGHIHLDDVLDMIDQLHTAASEGTSGEFAGMSDADVVNYLRDIVYTAQETMNEIQAAQAQRKTDESYQPPLRIVRKK